MHWYQKFLFLRIVKTDTVESLMLVTNYKSSKKGHDCSIRVFKCSIRVRMYRAFIFMIKGF